VQTVYALSRRDVGFTPEGLLTFQMEFRGDRYSSGPARVQFLDAAVENLAALPGVEAAGITSVNPFCCGDVGIRLTVEGQPPVPAERAVIAQHMLVTPTFFSAMRIPLREGRTFTDQDREDQPPVVVVDEHFARRFWPGRSAIGKRVKRGLADSTFPWMTIVGVVAPIEKNGDYGEMWYLPFRQLPLGPSSTAAHAVVRVRGDGDPLALLPSVRRAIGETDALMPVFRPATMAQLGRERYAQRQLGAAITATLAVAGLVLAVLGVYGLMSSAVAGETRAIAIRLALGAPRRRVMAGVVTRALKLGSLGAAIGLPLAWMSAGGLRALVENLAPVHWSLFAGIGALLVAAVVVAALLPARRAILIDPLRALKD
jgi:predicted permease